MILKKILYILVPALQVQIAAAVGYLFCLVISIFYLVVNDGNLVKEKPEVLLLGLLISLILFAVGTVGVKYINKLPVPNKSLRRGAYVVLLTWFIACSVSAIVFIFAGFPDPDKIGEFSLFRRFVDGFFESMSGFTTTGSSILPSVEAFPRGLLMWRSVMHLIGGMGIAYLGLTLIRAIGGRREEIINGEAETHLVVEYDNEEAARESGFDFIKVYLLITGIMIVLMTISGFFFRQTPYTHWYDNVYDAVYFSFSSLGTGGFAPYDASAGLPVTLADGNTIIGGLKNPVSEWIITIFMLIAGANFALWYDLIYKRNWKVVFKNTELKAYIALVGVLGICIAAGLYFLGNSFGIEESLRYSFFNIASIISTTGLGNSDFTIWPALANGLLFVFYITGAMVGSTAGGLKII